ncbi:MAG: sodium:solute symporter [Lentimicrobiaceae bacterium]|nr:sodium:solute symporter [Lentimicrobiaceae bacterium]
MKPQHILLVFLGYTALIFIVSYITSRRTNNESYFLGNRKSPWLLVAYGMLGTSLSGVTFISVPGYVGASQFTYMMVVFGYLLGYATITLILLPLYYRLKLTSIYTYLEKRFGNFSYKTGSFYFLLSRMIGASFRMYLVINVLQIFIFDHFGVPFWFTTCLFLLLITVYTYKGGIKTIVWTDTLQTTFMLASLIITIFIVLKHMDVNLPEMIQQVKDSSYAKIVDIDWRSDTFYIKQFLSGMFITIVMTGLDQDMMQKNLSCKSLKDAQKNMTVLSFLFIPVNFIFLFLGATLLIYAAKFNISLPEMSDNIFPELAINHFGTIAGLVFFIGLIASAYSSADSAITALTTSVCVDFLGFEKEEQKRKNTVKTRYIVNFFVSLTILFLIILFREINNEAVIKKLFTIAGYTYGPLLGLFAYGLFTKRGLRDKLVPIVCLISPLLSYLIDANSEMLFNGYKFGFEILIVNGLITFIGLFLISLFQKKAVTIEN